MFSNESLSRRTATTISALLLAGTVAAHLAGAAPASAGITTAVTCPEGSALVAPAPGGESVGATAGDLCAVVFTKNGSFTVPDGVDTVDVVVVGGGGGGGAGGSYYDDVMAGGGGGGGQVALYTGVAVSAPVTVTVGAGGTGAVVPCTFAASYTCPDVVDVGFDGTNGGPSSFGDLTAGGGSGGKGGSVDTEELVAGNGGASPRSTGTGVSDGGTGGNQVNTTFDGEFVYIYNAGGGGAGAGGNGGSATAGNANCSPVAPGDPGKWMCGGNGGPGVLPMGGNINPFVWMWFDYGWFDAEFGSSAFGRVGEYGFGPGGAGAAAGLEYRELLTEPPTDRYTHRYDAGYGVPLDPTASIVGGLTAGAKAFSNAGNVDGTITPAGTPNQQQGKSLAWIESGHPVTFGGGGSGGVATKEVLYGNYNEPDPWDVASDGIGGIVIVVFPAPGGATPTTTTYTGDSGIVTAGTPINLGYSVDPAECVTDAATEISYALIDANGNETAIVSSPLSTTNLAGGVYDLVVRFSGNDGCEASEGSAVLVIGAAGDSVTGGGTYDVDGTISGSNRAHFGFTVQKTEKYDRRTNTRQITQRGQMLWMNNHQWRLKASLYARWAVSSGGTTGDSPIFANTTCPVGVGTSGSNAKCGVITGSGYLERWNSDISDWERATEYGTNGLVRFSTTIYDGGSVKVCKNRRCTITDVADWFGLRITGVTTNDGIPVGDPVQVRKQRNGAIVIRG